MKLIVERRPRGAWECYAERSPEVSFGGPSASVALERAANGFGLTVVDLDAAGPWDGNPERLVFRRKETCPDCGGGGRYVGLATVENRGRCGGDGKT